MKAISALAVTLSFAVALPGHSETRRAVPPAKAARPVGHPVLPRPSVTRDARRAAITPAPAAPWMAPAELNAVVKQYCQKCHNPTMKRGNLSLADFDVGAPDAKADVAEKVVAKASSSRPTSDRTMPAASE